MKSILSTTAYFVLIILLWLFFLVTPNGASPIVIWPCLGIFYWIAVRSLFRTFYIVPGVPTFLGTHFFFLVFYFILLYLPYQKLMFGVGNLATNSFVTSTFPEQTNRSILLSTMGIVAFFIGSSQLSKKRISLSRYVPSTKSFDTAVGVSVLLLFIVAFGLYARSGLQTLLTGTYIGANSGLTLQSKADDGIYFLITHFVSIGVATCVFFYFKYKKFNTPIWLLLLCGVGWALLLLIAGDRNAFFIVATILVAGYGSYFKKISRPKIAFLIFAALFLYQVIEISRQAEERSFSGIFSALTSFSEKDNEKEDSSFTITTVTSRAAVELVPDYHDYFYGKFKIIGIAGIVPFSRSLFVDSNDPYVTSADLLSEGVLGSTRTWSVGSNIVSDIYVDLGIPGLIILMYFLGYWGSYVQFKAQSRPLSSLWSVMYLLCVALYSELPRYSFDFPVRSVVWTFFLFWSVGVLMRMRKKFRFSSTIKVQVP